VRKNDLRNIQNALETYHSDNDNYPLSAATLDVLEPTYLNNVPKDPKGADYSYESDGTTYTVTATLENANDPAANQGAYSVTNPSE
jgi:type II secretory pathway pseudopilin PulG